MRQSGHRCLQAKQRGLRGNQACLTWTSGLSLRGPEDTVCWLTPAHLCAVTAAVIGISLSLMHCVPTAASPAPGMSRRLRASATKDRL